MSGLRQNLQGSRKFYARGIALYPKEELYKEMAFISYYFHWSQDEIMNLDHGLRRQWCSEISEINRSLNPSDSRKEKSILDMRPPSF